MTFPAVFEREIPAKRLPTVVTAQTRHAPRRYEMFGGCGRTDLACLRCTCGEAVTIGTGEALSGPVVRMTERVAIGARVGAGGPVCLLLVTDSARRHLAARVVFTFRRVTRVAIAVCGNVRRDRQARAAIHWCVVTARATSLRARGTSVVLGVIEFDVELFVEARGKTLQRRIVARDICVADNAHRYRRRCELSAVTVGAGFVTGKMRG